MKLPERGSNLESSGRRTLGKQLSESRVSGGRNRRVLHTGSMLWRRAGSAVHASPAVIEQNATSRQLSGMSVRVFLLYGSMYVPS